MNVQRNIPAFLALLTLRRRRGSHPPSTVDLSAIYFTSGGRAENDSFA